MVLAGWAGTGGGYRVDQLIAIVGVGLFASIGAVSGVASGPSPSVQATHRAELRPRSRSRSALEPAQELSARKAIPRRQEPEA